ncbi:MAG: permease [Treponema sp.]|nr:permease [Treponema sp.]
MLIRFLPYFIAGIMAGEFIKFASWTKIIYKWVSKSPSKAVVSASVIGIISPLCTYGTIPIVMELYKSKVRISPLIAFLAASSLMNPQLFIMTAGGINLEMAIVRTSAVFIFSLATGMLVFLIPEKYLVRKNISFYEDGGCAIINREKKFFIAKQYLLNCLKNIKSIGPYLLVGVAIGAVVIVYVPQDLVWHALRAGRIQSILAGALLGIPMNACGGSAIPFVEAMILNGMGKGTALAFFIVGPALRPAPLMAMAALFTPLLLLGYGVFLVFSSVIMGLIYV